MKHAKLAAALFCLGLLSVAAAQTGYFGKNKVQTRDYRFRQYDTEHFRILFYPGGEALAEFAARSAEQYYASTSAALGVELPAKTPLIIYLSPGQFGETNVILDIIEEGVGGFSELMKNRIVIPFNGSYHDFHHVIGHELVHIFEFQLFYRSRLAALLGAVSELSIPLWVMEGFAEYHSGWAAVRSESFMRDLVLANRVVPLDRLHDGMGYLVYREGESFFRFVEERYGAKKVYEFINVLAAKRSIDVGVKTVFGLPLDKLSREWEDWLRVRYWPQVTGVANFSRTAQKLTDHQADGSVYNTAPAMSPSGTKIAIVSDRNEYADVYVISSHDGRVLRRLVRGGRSGGFENLHLLRPGLAWSPDERTLAAVTTSAGRDNIALVAYPSGKIRRRIGTGIDAIYSPRYSPDGARIVFAGVRNGYSDIYEVDLGTGNVRRLTYDQYDDRDPVYSPGGDTVVFVSDRPDPGGSWNPGSYAIWLAARTTPLADPERRTGRCQIISHPEFTSDGRHVWFAAADSSTNLNLLDLATDSVIRRTCFLGDATYPTLSRDGSKLSFAYYANTGWDIAIIADPMTQVPPAAEPGVLVGPDDLRFEGSGLDFGRVKPSAFGLSLDYAVGAASYATGSYGGLSGVLAVAFSDMLGNHRFDLYTDLYGDVINSDLLLRYWLLPHRTDFGFALFQFRDYPAYVPGAYFAERVSRGGQFVAAYPLDRFTRAELGVTGYYSQVDFWRWSWAVGNGAWLYAGRQGGWTSYASPALVFDNTYWTGEGPVRGTRARLATDVAFLSRYPGHQAYLDVRNYVRLGRSYVFATSFAAIGSFGPYPDSFSVGGENVRGFDWYEFSSNRGRGVTLASVELRYPFIERLKLGFPLPLEFGGIRGVAFADAGLVIRDGVQLWDSDSDRLSDLKVGVGVGLRVQVSYFLLKFDFAKPLSVTDDRGWKFVFGIGSDF
jgi:Tol biopolymer transport system component